MVSGERKQTYSGPKLLAIAFKGLKDVFSKVFLFFGAKKYVGHSCYEPCIMGHGIKFQIL